MFDPNNEVIIIGAGVFGLSTALALVKRYPGVRIHVIDRFEPPVPDGSSTDTTRCLRFDYTKKEYAELSKQSMDIIERDPEIAPLFHKVGMTFVYDGKQDKWGDIWHSQLEEVIKINVKDSIEIQETSNDVYKKIHGTDIPPGLETRWNKAYTNKNSGYIEADNAMKAYYEKCKKFSQIAFTFQEVDRIVYSEGTTKAEGIKFVSGAFIPTSFIIVAAGAWSCKLVNLAPISKSSCIEVGWFKVSNEEQERWKNMSITTNLSTGINTFPPYNGEMKVLRRSPGFVNTITIDHPTPDIGGQQVISYPRTIMSHPDDWIPKDAEDELRSNLKEILPPLASRPFDRTKVCWLTQTKSANFLIDYHPELEGIVMATCGSAHAWKFVPVIGDKIVDFLEGNLDPVLKDMWSWEEKLRDSVDNGSAPRMTGISPEMGGIMRKNPFAQIQKI